MASSKTRSGSRFATFAKIVVGLGLLGLLALGIAVGFAYRALPDYEELNKRTDLVQMIRVLAADGTLLNSFSAAPRATLHFGARWTPDGKALAYIVTEKDVSNIWIQPVDGSPPRRLTDFTVGSIYHFVFSRDGERLYLARGTQIRDALLISTSR